MTTTTEGTVIHATLRPEDLIPAFMSEIDRIIEMSDDDSPDAVASVGRCHDRLGDIERRMEIPGYFETDEPYWDLEYLVDTLNELAPEGLYFGAHEGDGSDFGFWAIETDWFGAGVRS